MKKTIRWFIVVAAWLWSAGSFAQSDITNTGGTVSAQYSDSPANEGIANVVDNVATTKYLTFHNAAWIQFSSGTSYVVTSYAITSANDAPERDPLTWTFQGSNNGTTWTPLNSQSNQDFPNRLQRREFSFTNTTAYTHYRLNMTNNSGNILQLAEWEINGTVPGVVTAYQHTNYGGTSGVFPVGNYTLAQMQARGVADNWISSVRVTAGYQVAFYENDNFSGASLTKTADDATLVDDSWNDRASSMMVSAAIPTPPATWQEHWFEHNQLVSRKFYDNDVIIYFDNDMDQSITWLNTYVGNAWRYAKQTYGNMNGGAADQRLWGVFHQNKYGGGHPSYYYESDHDYRNVIDLGQNGSWSSPTGWALDATIHEIGHIVESTTHNAQGSPAFPLWGDSQWCVIFQYDVYVNLGWTSEATRWYNAQIGSTASYPRANTYWFRDWFYPIWNNYGRASVLKKFFQLLSQYFPKNGQAYSRNMNWGEFVHFWSGAAGVNLKTMATTAFGWPSTYETQFNQARIDFPFSYDETPPPVLSSWAESKLSEPANGQALLSLWPNPSESRVFNVALSDKAAIEKVQVFSQSGELVSQVIVKDHTATIDLSKHAKGLYIVLVYYHGKVARERIKLD
ncbi:MAG: T9SS type A sorting domain-containing protein [Bacteroidota bacterium]